MDIDWSGVNLGDFDSSFIDEDLQRRLRKTLYYGKNPLTDRTSLPVTELAVELLQHAAPRELGKIDTQLAASISRKACLSPCSLMLGLIYIDRLRQKSPEYLQQISSADLFIVAMMVASKFLHDDGEDGVYNDEWAESAGMGTETVNDLEREFLRAIDWNLLAHGKEFRVKMEQLERCVALRKGKERLWKLSYTDLWVFLRNLECLQLFKSNVTECLKIFGAVVSTYVLGVVVVFLSLSAVTSIRAKMMEKAVGRIFLGDPKSESVDRLSFGSNDRILARSKPQYFQTDDEASSTVDVEAEGRRQQRPLCCRKWQDLLTQSQQRQSRNYQFARLTVTPWSHVPSCCNCDEKTLARNLKIKENGFNASFAQEKANDSWVHSAFVDGSTSKDTAVRSPLRVQVFG